MPQRPDYLYPGGSPLMHPTLKLGLRRVNLRRIIGHAREPYISFFSHCLSFLISSSVAVGAGL